MALAENVKQSVLEHIYMYIDADIHAYMWG